MKRTIKFPGVLILILIGAWSAAQADLSFTPYVYSYRKPLKTSQKWEQDAQVVAEVWWKAPSLGSDKGVTAIDGSFLYDTNVFEYGIQAGQPGYLNETDLTGLSSIVDSQYRAAPGSALFSRTIAASGDPILYAAKDYKAYTPWLQIKASAAGTTSLAFNTDFAKVIGKDANGITKDITGARNNLGNIQITAADPPKNFSGPTNAVNVYGKDKDGNTTNRPIGNTVTISWTDLNNQDAPFTNDDTPPIKYDIYYGMDANFQPTDIPSVRISADRSGNSMTYGDNGKPGSPLLKDKTNYYFRMRAKDSTTKADDTDRHKTTYTDPGKPQDKYAMVHVNDYTAPEGFRINTMDPANQQLTVGWTEPDNNKNDLVGYIVLRKIIEGNENPEPPGLGGAADDNDGPDYGNVNEIGGWLKVYQGNSNQYVDDKLDNKIEYKYAVYAYDEVSSLQQGRNYSTAPATAIGQPGEAPDTLSNFIAISSPEAKQITLMWDIPGQSFYKGAKVVYTTNKNEWAGLTVISPAAAKVDFVASENKKIEIVPLLQIGGKDLDPAAIYYFKAFSYNDSDMSKPAGAMAAALPALSGAGGVLTVGGIPDITVDLIKKIDGFGINTVVFPYTPIYYKGTTIATLGDLISKINEFAGKPVVTTIGYWDRTSQQTVGFVFDDKGNVKSSKGPIENPSAINLESFVGYQIYVTDSVKEMILKGAQ